MRVLKATLRSAAAPFAMLFVAGALVSCSDSATPTAPATQTESVVATAPATTPSSASVSVGAPASITKVFGDAQTGRLGAALPLLPKVVVKDASGNPVPGVTVTWAVTAGGDHSGIVPVSATTDALGFAKATWSLGTRLDVTHTATASVTGLTPATFTAIPKLQTTAKFTKVAPTTQYGIIGLPLRNTVGVCVKLVNGWTVQGATVNWTVTAGGGVVSSLKSKTALNCRTQTKWTMGATAGLNTLQASVEGLKTTKFNITSAGASKMWTGAVNTDFATSGNWYPLGAPSTTDSIYLPPKQARYPTLAADATTGSVIMSGTATLTLGNFQYYTSGSFGGVATGLNTAAINMSGLNVGLHGNLPRLKVTGTVLLNGRVVSDNLIMSTTVGDTARFNLNGHTLQLRGGLTAGGKLVMNNPVDSVIVSTGAVFKEATSRLNAGTIIVRGNFNAYVNVFPSGFFQGQGTNTVIFNGSSAQAVTGSPVFRNLVIANSAGVSFMSSVGVLGQLTLASGSFSTDASATLDLNDALLDAATTVNNNGTTQYNTLTDNGATINGNSLVQKP